MDVGRTSPYRPQLSSIDTNESSDCSSKSISLDLAENPVVSFDYFFLILILIIIIINHFST